MLQELLHIKMFHKFKNSDKRFEVVNNKKKNVSYYEEIKPALVVLQLIGRFPYRIEQNGVGEFSPLSLPAVYSLLYYLVSSALAAWSHLHILQEQILAARELEVLLFWLLILLFGLQTYLLPLTSWTDAPATRRYFHQWARFEEWGGEAVPGGGRWVRLSSLSALPLAAAYMLLDKSLFDEVSFLLLAQFVPLIAAVQLTLTIWAATLFRINNSATRLAHYIIKTEDAGVALSRGRRQILELAGLARGLGSALGWTLLTTSLLFFISFVLCLYGALGSTSPRAVLGLLAGAIFLASPNLFLCETGHRATKAIQKEFILRILKTDVTAMSDASATEIRLIFRGMTAVPPVIEFNGYVTANRNTLLKILANAATYLIVLVQFNSTAIVCDDPHFNTTISKPELSS